MRWKLLNGLITASGPHAPLEREAICNMLPNISNLGYIRMQLKAEIVVKIYLGLLPFSQTMLDVVWCHRCLQPW